jgi:putative aldouronate transport system permease protein
MMEGCKYPKMTSLSNCIYVCKCSAPLNFDKKWRDLEEAAEIDGAGAWRTLWQIVVPISKPVIATIVLFVSVGYWNEYFQGLVLMNKESNYPLQTYIRQITVQIPVGVTLTAEQYATLAANSNKSLEAAKVFISMVPMLIVYPWLQKYFVTGITIGAVKE